MKRFMTHPSQREVDRREAQAKRERLVRDMKDLAGIPYMGQD